MWKKGAKYILEAIIVAFGVVLGLLLNEWNQNRKLNEDVRNTLIYIDQELKTNHESFLKAIKYHEKINHEFDSIARKLDQEKAIELDAIYFKDRTFKHFYLPSWNGLGIPEPDILIHESAKINGTYQNLNIETLQIISQIYMTLESYNKVSDVPESMLLNIDSRTTNADVYRIFEFLQYDIIHYEKRIARDLEETRQKLKVIIDNKTYIK